ncbi:glycoside hydrolase family 113 [Microvirga solisilvae]|uniref:glycoside hydrolase family 113 n=1 Tax=Microvirga solisilvae TaxID=2919498 RepID=UPI0024340C5B|nr:hypothetical protein [Microvirga solisilvae]
MSTKKKSLPIVAIPTWVELLKQGIAGSSLSLNSKKISSVRAEKDAYVAIATLEKAKVAARAASKVTGILRNGTEGDDSLVGGAGGDTLNGAGGNDTLFGGEAYDRLNGGAGDDRLDGGLGSDALAGGTGNDTYIVDTTGDAVTELANEGTDTVISSVSWTLGSNVENLTLTGTSNLNGTGNTLNNVLIGNAGSNLLSGGAGNDTLDGGVNAAGKIDTLAGGAGNDTYVVRSASDVVREYANDGTDTVQTALNYTLAANVENLVLTGTAGLTGTGNELANHITGNDGANLLQGQAGNDTILGGGGNDTLDGGTGNDVLTGGTGADLFRFQKAGGQDTITDFNASQGDLIDLTGTGITGLDKFTITFNGTAYVIALGDGSTITLTGAQAPQASWFKFDPVIGGGGTGGGGTPSGSTDGIFTWEGISLPSYWGGNFQTSGGLSAMDLIKSNGANTITMVPNFFMSNEYSNDVKLNLNSTNPWASESDTLAQVKQGILDASSRGLKVVVKPHVETDNRVWRALIEPTDPKAWFQNYKNMMVEYAKVAQEGGAAMFVVGTEMKSMTDPTKFTSDGKSYTQNWIEIIDAVKSVFSGKITYAATDEEAMDIQFWDHVDYIGVDAYFSMTNSNNPTVQELIDSWIKPATNWNSQQVYGTTSVVDTWKNLSEQWGKKVIFTEIGYGSYDGVNKSPGWIAGSTVDLQEQKDAYEALYHVMKNYGGQWLDGAFLWSYQASTSGLPGTDYTTQGKPADTVIKDGYSSPAHVTGIVRTGTTGADKLDGGYNNDTLSGGAGNDTLWGGAGNDTISGGADADRFEFGSGSGADRIQDFELSQLGEVIAVAKNVNGLDLSTFEQLMARTTMSGTDAVIDFGNGNSITLVGVNKAMLNASHFVFI